MATDYFPLAEDAVGLIATAITILALYRAVGFGRVLVRGTYRRRAIWTAVFLLATLFFFLNTSGIPYLSFGAGGPGIIVVTFAMVLFVDGSVRAAQDTDFFHRDTFRWRTLGRPAVIVTIVSGTILLLGALTPEGSAYVNSLSTNPPAWVVVGVFQYFVVLGVVIPYGAASLIVAARRTEDRTMKRFVKMLGFSLLGFVLFFTTWIPLALISNDVSNLGSDIFTIPAAFYLYQAAMSLSPLGRIDRSVESSLEAPPSKAGFEASRA